MQLSSTADASCAGPLIEGRATDDHLFSKATLVFVHEGCSECRKKKGLSMAFLLWILAVVLVVSGFVSLIRKQWVQGILLILVGFLVGPGGVSLFT